MTNINYYSILGGRQYFISADSIWNFNSRYDKDSEIDSVTGYVVTFPNKLAYSFEGMVPTSSLTHFYLPHINLQDVESNNVLWQHDVWSNVDLTLNSTGELEYVFKSIDDNAFNQIAIHIDGSSGIDTIKGGFVINTLGEPTIYDNVKAYQIVNDEVKTLALDILINGSDISFHLLDQLHDTSAVYLYIGKVIPTYGLPAALWWSTYIETTDANYSSDIVADENSNVYFGGTVMSQSFPSQSGQIIVNPFWLSNHGGFDGIIGKFDVGRHIMWRAYLGGYSYEWVNAIALDKGTGNNQTLAIVGKTGSNDFMGIANNYVCASCQLYNDHSFNGGQVDGFIIRMSIYGKFNSNTTNMATYFGGDGNETINAVVFDTDNNIYIGGSLKNTQRNSFPYTQSVANQFFLNPNLQPTQFQEGFIAKFDANQVLTWCTQFGGQTSLPATDLDEVTALTIKNNYNLIVYGITGDPGEYGGGAPLGGVYGNSVPMAFPVIHYPGNSNSYQQTNNGGIDCFLAEFNSDNKLMFSTMLGGSDNENQFGTLGSNWDVGLNSLCVDNLHNIWVGGLTNSTSGAGLIGFPTMNWTGNSGAYYKSAVTGISDGFITQFSPQYTLLYSTLWGGSSFDEISAISQIDNNMVFAGNTRSTNMFLMQNNNKFTYFESNLNKLTNNSSSPGVDGFVITLNKTGHQLTYSSFFGGRGNDIITGMTSIDDIYGDLFIWGNSFHPSSPGLSFPSFFPLKDLPGNYDYFYNGNTVWSPLFISNFQLNCPNCPRISDELEIENSTLVYPNPVNGLLHINNNGIIKEISIYDLIGSLVEVRKVNNADDTQIDVSHFSQGTYFLQVLEINGSNTYYKFIVQ